LDSKVFVARVFVAAESKGDFLRFSAQIKDSFAETNFPFSILSECPEKPWKVFLEVGFVDSLGLAVEYGRIGLVKYCKIAGAAYNEYWFGGVEGLSGSNSIAESADSAFYQLLNAFLQLGLDFNQVVRQWNYVEQIAEFEQIEGVSRQNYQLFNEVRSNYYSKYRTIPDFPAATGIGVTNNGVTIECVVVEGHDSLKSIAIGNPNQLNSYQYGQLVLKGEPPRNRSNNQPPQFERARFLTDGKSSRLFVSGTASIVGQETVGLDDVEKQTRVTIDNIELLTSAVNLKEHCPELDTFPDKYAYVRVYVKRSEDIPSVRSICREHFGQVPMTFVQADICRADLLVEIEAEKLS